MAQLLNVLLITADQLRWDFYHNTTVESLRTPAITRLAAEGTTLPNTFSNSPICMPTRFTWLYGLYASQAAERLLRNAHDWPQHLPSAAHALQRNGYRTALTGKLHSLAGLHPHDLIRHESVTRARGFDDVFEVSGKSLAYWYDCRYTRHLETHGLLAAYRREVARRCAQLGGEERCEPSPLETGHHMDAVIGSAAEQWLRDCDARKPFFLHASFCSPHFPLDPPSPYFDRYRPEDMPPPRGVDDSARIRAWQEQRALYCGLIALLDDQVGRLLEVIDERNLADGTLVLFTSDHGDMMGHLNRSGKGQPYDTSCRTPVIARLPGRIASGRVLDGMAEAVDLPCTILEAAGCCSTAESLQHLLPCTPGRSYWQYLTGGAPVHRPWIFSECNSPRWRMCRDPEWKYVMRPAEGDLLLNVAEDPAEQTNLARDPAHSDRLQEMRKRLLESMTLCVAPNTDGGAGLRRSDPARKLHPGGCGG